MNTSTTPANQTGYSTKNYRTYVLTALLVVYVFNFIDRVIIGLIAEPIKVEFGLNDTMVGLLGGPAFALLYTTLGIPIARLAEKYNRVTIISICLFAWSLMTVLCGAATSFWMLAAFRVGVSIGEAGCSPPATSIIADYFKPTSRANAMSVYATGITIGGVCASLIAAFLVDELSWRGLFYLVGTPGIFLAIILKLSVKEPPRGFTDPGVNKTETPGFKTVIRVLLGKPTFWHMTAGATISSMALYGMSNFNVSFLIRTHELSYTNAILVGGGLVWGFGAVGTFLVGRAIHHYSKSHERALAWVPALTLVASAPLLMLAFNAGDWRVSATLLSLAAIGQYGHLGAMYTIGQGVVAARMRATTIAILAFVINIIGYGLGPLLVGILSDIFATLQLGAVGLTSSTCLDAATLGADQLKQCSDASADGLRIAATLIALLYVWAGAHYWLCGKTLKRDMQAASE